MQRLFCQRQTKSYRSITYYIYKHFKIPEIQYVMTKDINVTVQKQLLNNFRIYCTVQFTVRWKMLYSTVLYCIKIIIMMENYVLMHCLPGTLFSSNRIYWYYIKYYIIYCLKKDKDKSSQITILGDIKIKSERRFCEICNSKSKEVEDELHFVTFCTQCFY
jgi:hypothetical protein